MGRKQDLLLIGDSGDFEIILYGTKPVFCFDGLDCLGKDRWGSFLEVTEGRPLVIMVVVVIVIVLSISS